MPENQFDGEDNDDTIDEGDEQGRTDASDGEIVVDESGGSPEKDCGEDAEGFSSGMAGNREVEAQVC